ncbi:MAG TPA: phage terminase large subunit family protein, partial [Rhodanobacteraceae bacterium]|nr:phage terminase large subunit family protein [Rhodanobacteraceae bacterium]
MWSKRKPKLDHADLLAGFIQRVEEETGDKLHAEVLVIKPGETFKQWCIRLATPSEDGTRKGLMVDGKPFKLDDRPAMAWIYDQIPSTEDEAYRLVLVLMKCAQVGFTVMEMLACLYIGLRFGPATVGMFLPDMNLADIKSAERFVPLVRSVPDVHKLMTRASADDEKKKGEGNVRIRRIGRALYVFSWTSGRVTTESVPMDMLSFDEVQQMTLDQIEKTLERLSASDLRFVLMGSTANWPEVDIDHWYRRGAQYQFHTQCKTCGEARPMDEYFPQCIKWNPARDAWAYVCPNGHWIDDTQYGEWIAKHPERDKPVDPSVPKRDRPLRIRSIHFPQMLSPTISATEIMDAYNTAESMKNFYNRKLGKPYTDPSQVPVTMAHLHECERQGIAAGLEWKTEARNCYMGIDQMGRFNVVVIKERMPDGRQAIVHLEEINSDNPFARCDQLMEAYGVLVAVVEINPNYNDAKAFANRWPGRVFIVDSFGTLQEGMLVWGDAPKLDVSERRTTDEARDRYTLRMDQYKCMQWAMARFTASPPMCLFPDRRGLEQDVIDKGVKQRAQVAPRMWFHLTRTALVSEISDEDKKKGIKHYKRSVRKIGIDPHFS